MKLLDRWKLEPNARLGASTGAKSTGIKQAGNDYHRLIYRLIEPWVQLNMPDWKLYVEPWYRRLGNVHALRSPDIVLVHEATSTAIVADAKLNWASGRDVKLINEYLPIVQSAMKLEMCWPLIITRCLRGYPHRPLIGFKDMEKAMSWQPGDPTPVMLVLK